LKFRKDRLAQLAPGCVANEIANHDGGRCCEKDGDQHGADGRSSCEGVPHRCWFIKTTLTLVIFSIIYLFAAVRKRKSTPDFTKRPKEGRNSNDDVRDVDDVDLRDHSHSTDRTVLTIA
jgi:hypothetical protein